MLSKYLPLVKTFVSDALNDIDWILYPSVPHDKVSQVPPTQMVVFDFVTNFNKGVVLKIR